MQYFQAPISQFKSFLELDVMSELSAVRLPTGLLHVKDLK